MQITLRPLPGAPPPRLTPTRSADIRSHRPLPSPPVQSANTFFVKSLYLHTPPTLTSSSAGSLVPFLRPRPKLRISAKSPLLRRRDSLEPLTIRTPALRDAGQTLAPAVDRWNNPVAFSRSWRGCTPHNSERYSRVSSSKSFGSPLVFKGRIATIEAYIPEGG